MALFIWLVVGLVALVGEMLSLALYLGCFAVAAFVTAAFAGALSLTVQIALFSAMTLALIVVARPLALRVLPVGTASDTTPQIAPSSEVGTVVEEVSRGRGQIRVGNGEFWSARPRDPDAVYRRGEDVQIVAMTGLTAVVEPLASSPPDIAEGPNGYGLSDRELEVVALITEGLTNAEIAEQLVISPRTVHHHVSHILTKMGADNRTEVARKAIELKMMHEQ